MLSALVLLLAASSTGNAAVVKPTCPSPASLTAQQPSLVNYNSSFYQGEWFPIAHNEPTEPSFCDCDRITWLFNEKKPGEFKEDLDAHCVKGPVDFALHLPLSGKVLPDPSIPALRLEGSPPLAAWIPNTLVYLEQDADVQAKTGYTYTAAIIFSCKENYLFQSLFSSLQIFSRLPLAKDDETVQRLLAKAKELGVLTPEKESGLRFPQSSQCKYPASRLPSTFAKA